MVAPSESPASGQAAPPGQDASRSIARILANGDLTPHFQPVVRLRDGLIMAHECLIRGPRGTPLWLPGALFEAARVEALAVELELACFKIGIGQWASHGSGGKLFLNASSSALVATLQRYEPDELFAHLRTMNVSPECLVVELTKHGDLSDVRALVSAVNRLRAGGVQFALDDFGDGRSNLRLWVELRPEIVKVDKYFSRDIGSRGEKVQMLESLVRVAERFGTLMVAQGIETESELKVIRDIGIQLGQGYFLGRPETLLQGLPALARAVLASNEIAVLPGGAGPARSDFQVDRLLIRAPCVAPTASHETVAEIFQNDETLHALAIVDGTVPIGLLNREKFFDGYAKPYFKELYGRRPCTLFAHTAPLVLDRHTGVDTLSSVLTSDDQRYLSEGFIVTEGGRYLGIGTGEQLVRAVTEIRVEAARHANPLTFLPGNIPISQHIARLLASGNDFVACYGDLNHFKPFNDHYGYWQGDEMIRLAARIIVSHCDGRRDFVGHVGGDDFVMMFQSVDWRERCERIVAAFDECALALYDAKALGRGGIEAEDRHGIMRFFGFTTLSIGAVRVRSGAFLLPEQVASAAAAAKHKAKLGPDGLFVDEA